MARTIVLFAAGAAAALAGVGVVAACTRGHGGTRFAATTILSPSASPAAGSTSGGGSYGRPIRITETEYSVSVGVGSLRPGIYTFAVKNDGRLVHAINFDGPHIEDATTGRLAPGQTGTMTLDLSTGSYRVYCPLPGHKSMGMETTITVG